MGTSDCILVTDEEIDINNQGWAGQQVVKSQFWNLGLCENYFCIDSDNYFIRPFYISDFMFDDDTPYTICHEYKSFFEFTDTSNLPFDPYESFVRDRTKIMDLFGRTGVIYDFGPDPIIWSTKVWKSLFENYIEPNKLTFANLIQHDPSEFTWYGEWLLASREIRLIPREEMFKNYHYRQQYEFDKQAGITEEKLSRYYLGICLNGNMNDHHEFKDTKLRF